MSLCKQNLFFFFFNFDLGVGWSSATPPPFLGARLNLLTKKGMLEEFSLSWLRLLIV